MTPRTITNPRRAVTEASLSLLMMAYADAAGLAIYDDEMGTRCVCPHCGGKDRHNPTAQILDDGWRWHCWQCRFRGTRAYFERIVIENADALDRLLELRDEVIN